MHRFTRLVAATFVAGTVLFAGTASTFATAGIAGHLYVNNNSSGENTVAGFNRSTDGTLSPMAGSPFEAGGVGTGTPLGSAGSLRISADSHFLIAVDSASNQLSVLRIKADGSLKLVNSSPVSSQGYTPVSIAVHSNLIYVANDGAGGSNYTGFHIDTNGSLAPIAGSTYWLPDAAQPGEVLFNGDGNHLVGTRVGTSQIDSFAVKGTGTGKLVAAPGSPFAAQGLGPFGSEFSPTDPTQLFVSNAHNGAGLGTVSSYHVANDGTLNPVSNFPVADNQTAPCWVALSPNGQYLFAVNTAVPSISSYGVNANGRMHLLGSLTMTGGPGIKPFDAQLDPYGFFLYVVDAGSAQISAFSVAGGSITELPSSPISVPGGAAPFGLVVD